MIKYSFKASKREIKNWKNAFGNKKASDPAIIKLKKIGLMDPSIGTSNMGDYIIQDAVKKYIRQIFPSSFVSTFPSQLSRKMDSVNLMQGQDIVLVGGTNLLASNMESRFQWKVNPRDAYFLTNKIVLFGVGWWQYQESPNAYTSRLYNDLLSRNFIHSVRDSYTRDKLHGIGIKNVVNTTCPTLWELTPEKCLTIPRKKASDVITTLTFYNKNYQDDRALISTLQANYRNVYVWIQGYEDLEYLKELAPGMERIITVNPDLAFYNEVLSTNNDIEYVGTRLHAGVRALQLGKRTLIVAVDNRAVEISRDTNLNVIKREDINKCLDFINNDYSTDIRLPENEIQLWKSQFNNL